MLWRQSWRADPEARAIADRHYSRQNPNSAQFVPPGRCMVLVADTAVWVTSWPFAEYVKHDWPGAWMCSMFRNENPEVLSSELIRGAVAATRWYWPQIPELGMVTFVDAGRVASPNPGYCYLRAGFEPCGYTVGGLRALQLLAAAMPEPVRPLPRAGALFPLPSHRTRG